jgi:hypothetical protein
MRKLSFILTTTVMLIAAACSGEFTDPGMMDQPGGNGSFGGGGGGGGVGGGSGSGAYVISFDINGGTGTAPASKRGNFGSSIVLPNEKGFSRNGYTFLGWGLSPSSTTASYKAGGSYQILGNTTLYAIWNIPPTISDQTNPIPLNVNIWTPGNITSESPDKEAWYSFPVTSGTTYYVWWNDGFYGDNTKTLNVKISAYLNDSTTPISGLNEATNAFATAKSFTATSDGTVKLKVNPTTTSGTGTFAIAYTINNSRPYVPATVNFNINGGSGTAPSPITVNYGSNATLPNGSGFSKTNYTFSGWNTNSSGTGTSYSAGTSFPTSRSNDTLYAVWIHTGPTTPLTVNTWTNDSITSSTANGEIWYSFDVTSGATYYVWWNDGYSTTGDGTKTLDVKVSAYYSNNSPITGFQDTDAAWSSAKTFTANSNGTVKLKVSPYTTSKTGTFAIAYNTVNTKPPYPCTVTFNIRGGSGTAPSRTVLFGESITLPDSTGFSKSDHTLVAWGTTYYSYATTYLVGASYTVNASTTLYAFYTRNLPGSGTETAPYQLTSSKWADSFISSTASNAANWYSFNVTSGSTYYIYCHNNSYTDSSLQGATLTTKVSAYYSSDSSPIFDSENVTLDGKSFTATSTGTVKIKVFPSTSGNTGSFAIGYSTNGYEPRP